VVTLQGRGEPGVPANEFEDDQWGIEGQRKWSVLEVEADIMAVSFSERSTMAVEEHMRNSSCHRSATHLALKGQTQIRDRQEAVQAGSSHKDIPKFEGPSGQGQRLEARSGPGARWAQKTGLETRWASPEKVHK